MHTQHLSSLFKLPRELRDQIYCCCDDAGASIASFEIPWPLDHYLSDIERPHSQAEPRQQNAITNSGNGSIDFAVSTRNVNNMPGANNYGIAFTCQRIFEEYFEEYRDRYKKVPFLSFRVTASGHVWTKDGIVIKKSFGTSMFFSDGSTSFDCISRSVEAVNRIMRNPSSKPTRIRLHFDPNWSGCNFEHISKFLELFPNLEELDIVMNSAVINKYFFARRLSEGCCDNLPGGSKLKTMRVGWQDMAASVMTKTTPMNFPGAAWTFDRVVWTLAQEDEAFRWEDLRRDAGKDWFENGPPQIL